MIGGSGRRASIVLVRMYAKPRKGVRDEQGTGTGWHKEGRFHSDVGRQARKVGCERPSFCGLGDLPCQRITCGPEAAVCVADQRLVWTNYSALRCRRQDVGGARR